jgi:hypothetical protein
MLHKQELHIAEVGNPTENGYAPVSPPLVFFSFLMFFLNRRFHAIGCVLTRPKPHRMEDWQ